MFVGLWVVTISSIVGVMVGGFWGYAGGWADGLVAGVLFSVFVSVLAIAMVAFLGPSLKNLIVALSVIGWVGYARLMRAQVLKVREYDFVTAARALGATHTRLLFKNIPPKKTHT